MSRAPEVVRRHAHANELDRRDCICCCDHRVCDLGKRRRDLRKHPGRLERAERSCRLHADRGSDQERRRRHRRVPLALDAVARPGRLGDACGVAHAAGQLVARLLGSECSAPVDQGFLYNALPGLETISQGGIYVFLYSGGTNNFMSYQNGGGGAAQTAVGNMFLGTGMAWGSWSSSGATGQTVWGMTYNGTPIHYGWYQYMNVQNAAAGVPGVNTGLICSTALAGYQHDALSNGASGAYAGDVRARTYASAAIKPAAQALYNAVSAACGAQTGFWSSFSNAIQTIGQCALCFDCNLCDEAADQVTNCFAANNCGSSDGNIWHNATNSSAVTVSPDTVSCWNGNGTGAGCTGAGSSIWAYDTNQTVQWNSGGNSYSCWD